MVRSQALSIARFAAAGGVGVETIRYYQRRGLLRVPAGDSIRRYDADDVRRLGFIRSAQAAGFTLEQIGELLALDATDERARARDLAQRQIVALDAKIADLTRARKSLEKLAKECAKGHAGPCPILAAFDGG